MCGMRQGVQKSCRCASGVQHRKPSVLHVIAGDRGTGHCSSLGTGEGGRGGGGALSQETTIVV